MPGQAHSLYGPPAAVFRRQGGQVSSPLPGIGVNFFPQRRHRRFRTRRSSVSKNRPRLVPAISPPHAPDYRARARPGCARRPPIGIAVRRHSWDTGNRVPCVLRRSPRPRHVPHVTPRTPAPAPEAHSPQRRHRHGRCRPDSPCRDHRERRRGRHPRHSAPTTRVAPRRDRPHSGSWGHRTLIWHVRAQRQLPWRARAGYGEAWHHYSSRRWFSKAMGWTPPDPWRHSASRRKRTLGAFKGQGKRPWTTLASSASTFRSDIFNYTGPRPAARR